MLKYSKFKYNIGIYLPILFCIFILLFFRSNYSYGNVFIHKFLSTDYNLSDTFKLNNIIVYNLPEAMWTFSLTLLTLNYKLKLKKMIINIVYLPILYVWLAEYMQLIKITNGTFDLLDLILSTLSWGVAYLLLKLNKKQIKSLDINFNNLMLFILIFSSAIMADTI